MKTQLKKIMAYLLVTALCLGVGSYPGRIAQADTLIYESEYTDLNAGNFLMRTFKVPSAGRVQFYLYANEPIAFDFAITTGSYNSSTETTKVTADSSYWEKSTTAGKVKIPFYADFDQGSYAFVLIPRQNIEWAKVEGYYVDPASQTPDDTNTSSKAPSLASKSITLTKGFKGKISVKNAGSAKLSYSSDNKKVVTVNSAGTLTAKKKGKAVITVKTSTNITLKCNVTVKDNVYSNKKQTTFDKFSKAYGGEVSKVSYDTKGNMVIKVRLFNKSKKKVSSIKNLKITVKNKSGKKIGVYSAKEQSVSIPKGKVKTYTFKIKKSKLKIKSKQNLPFMKKPSVTGKFISKSSSSGSSTLKRG
ncbi:MAG: hypothetical protein J1E62_09035 [Lachnospiraceae bacterium]|nr:hypothetical protein [Lachnospiraceae bacterium]